MAEETKLSLTIVEGVDQFKAEGDAATVERLLTGWHVRVDQVKAANMADVARLSQLLPPGPGPSGAPPTTFRPRIVS